MTEKGSREYFVEVKRDQGNGTAKQRRRNLCKGSGDSHGLSSETQVRNLLLKRIIVFLLRGMFIPLLCFPFLLFIGAFGINPLVAISSYKGHS
jgi:hypothetical protein